MAQWTRIEWTDCTWNPVTGCTQVSAGCDHCYAMTLAHRRLRDHYMRREPVRPTPEAFEDPFAVRLWPERLREPARWSEPRRVFVNSMSDLFHVDIPDEYVESIFEVMLSARQHIYQILTKRPARAASFAKRHRSLFPSGVIPAHIWMGTSVEDQRVEHRVRQLRAVPCEVRFLSCEPLLGPLTVGFEGIHWVIVGGESGRGFRALDLDWARSIRDQCVRSNVPFFFKQVGGYTPKAGGRQLDGVEWNEMPDLALLRTC